MILDIHTHHPQPQPQAVISQTPTDFNPVEGQLYSVGIHPWRIKDATADYVRLPELLERDDVVALGECGVDLTIDVPLFSQMLWFKRQALLAREMQMPLIVHSVKAMQQVIDIYKGCRPNRAWALHGFRGKATMAETYLRAGDFYFSFGEKFNPETLRSIPQERILAETDESELTIEEIIERLSEAKGCDLRAQIEENAARFLDL